MDAYAEQTVLNKKIESKSKRNRALSIVRYFLGVIIVVLFFLFLFSPMSDDSDMMDVLFGFIFFLLCAIPLIGGIVFLTRFVNKSCEEFDYYLNGGIFRVVKIINRKKRKFFLEIKVADIESIGRALSDTHDRLASTQGIKKHLAVCDIEDDNDLVYIFYKESGVAHLLYICPDEQMTIALRRNITRFAVVDKSFNSQQNVLSKN